MQHCHNEIEYSIKSYELLLRLEKVIDKNHLTDSVESVICELARCLKTLFSEHKYNQVVALRQAADILINSAMFLEYFKSRRSHHVAPDFIYFILSEAERTDGQPETAINTVIKFHELGLIKPWYRIYKHEPMFNNVLCQVWYGNIDMYNLVLEVEGANLTEEVFGDLEDNFDEILSKTSD